MATKQNGIELFDTRSYTARFMEPGTVNDLYASLLNVTPRHLTRTMKSVTGKSPARWIDEAIVMEAKVLLRCDTILAAWFFAGAPSVLGRFV